ncbi:hypothetical protein UlMin_016991, partial [Ulmus minor]
MAQSQKGNSSANPKEKKAMLGKEFLTSWKTMSLTEDDAMDFGFNTVSGGKKKEFDFDKLDMDFNLDGDFDKLSNFKVDMSDFDFSGPSKKAEKPKERSEEESSTGNHQKKKNDFNFSFDFNELDNFKFDACLIKEEKASKKNQDSKKEIPSDGTECQGNKNHLSESIDVFDDTIGTKLSVSDVVATSKVETLLGGSGQLNSIGDDCTKSVTTGTPILSQTARSSPEKAIVNNAKAKDGQSHLSEKTSSTEPYSQQDVHDFPGESLVGIHTNIKSGSDGLAESRLKGTGKHTTSSGREAGNEKMMVGVASYHESEPLKNSSPPHITTSGTNNGERNKSSSVISTETVEDTEPAEANSALRENFTSFVPNKALHNIKDNKEDQKSAAEFSSALLSREVNSKDAQTGIEFRGNPVSVAGDVRISEDVLLGRAKDVKNVSNIREGFTFDGLSNGRILGGISRFHNEEATKREPIVPTSDKIVKDQKGFQVCHPSSPEKLKKSISQTCVNPKLSFSSMESMRIPDILPVEGSKLCLLKTSKKMPDLSTLKVSKSISIKAHKFISNSKPQREITSSRSSEKNVEVLGNAASETASPLNNNEKYSTPNLPLKRKLTNSDLASIKPLKGLSESLIKRRDFRGPLQRVVEEKFSSPEKSLKSDAEKSFKPLKSPSESRDLRGLSKQVNVKEALERVDEEKIGIHENHVQYRSKSILNNIPTVESPQEVNMMELEISKVTENDGNVEKAEAYTKELDD